MAIIISRNGKNAQKIEQTPPDQEGVLQRYISENPDSLPLDAVKDGAKLLVISREFDTPSGPIDVLALDDAGDIYVIETKLYKNPDKRLVIAQMLDYGAALWKAYGSGDDFLNDIDRCIAESKTGDLTEQLQLRYGFSDEEVNEAKNSIKNNLQKGNIKFVVLMDKMNERLRDLILFINQKSRFNIYAVEMEFYQHEGLEIVIPKLFGAEIKKEIGSSASGGGRKKWTKECFFEVVNRSLSPNERDAVKDIYDASNEIADTITWGTGAVTGSFSPKFLCASQRSFYTIYSDGTLSLNFEWHNRSAEEERFPNQEQVRDAFKRELEVVRFCVIPSNTEDVIVPSSMWVPKTKQFVEVVRKLFNRKG